MKVWICEAGHPYIPGIQVSVHAREESAESTAAAATNIIRADKHLPADATVENWREKMEEVEEHLLSDEETFVTVTEHEVLP